VSRTQKLLIKVNLIYLFIGLFVLLNDNQNNLYHPEDLIFYDFNYMNWSILKAEIYYYSTFINTLE
jgi:hypothetical protein